MFRQDEQFCGAVGEYSLEKSDEMQGHMLEPWVLDTGVRLFFIDWIFLELLYALETTIKSKNTNKTTNNKIQVSINTIKD